MLSDRIQDLKDDIERAEEIGDRVGQSLYANALAMIRRDMAAYGNVDYVWRLVHKEMPVVIVQRGMEMTYYVDELQPVASYTMLYNGKVRIGEIAVASRIDAHEALLDYALKHYTAAQRLKSEGHVHNGEDMKSSGVGS